ncbi:hypothetical protein MBLNU457_g2930t1 [Dothideomycetes sp. NU457]
MSSFAYRRLYSTSFASDPNMVMNAYYLLLGLNAIPFGLWIYARATKNERLGHRIQENTLVSAAAVDQGRWWTLLTSAFSHQEIVHFAFNMLTMRTMCQILSLVPNLHGGHILMVALGSGLAGSAGYVLQHKLAAKNSPNRGDALLHYRAQALGASGAVMGLSMLATCFLPSMPLQLMFIPVPIPLWAITAGYFAVDAYYLSSQTSRTAHAGHLGGLAFGAASYFVLLKGIAPFGVWYAVSRIFR